MKTMATIKPGDEITLRFYLPGGDSYTEPAKFIDTREDVDGRYKIFESISDIDGKSYQWEAYRFNEQWAYGTDAFRVTVAQD